MPVFPLNHRSLKEKLRSVMVLISVTGLVIAAVAFFINDLFHIRQAKIYDVSALANVISKDISVALAFNDEAAARETLSALKNQPHVIKACVYNRQRQFFTGYARPGIDDSACHYSEKTTIHLFKGNYMDLVRPLIWDHEHYGTLLIRYSLAQIIHQLVRYGIISVAILSVLISVVLFISHVLARYISSPLHNLARTADRISREGDYSIRAKRESRDEIGILVDGFNTMLEEIQTRDAKLAHQNILLEDKVKARTAELQSRNLEIENTNRRLEEAVKHANAMAQKAETANLYKSRFLASVSHEIRTPLNAILGFAELLEERVRSEKNRQYAAAVTASGRTLLSLINDILDLSKIEAGKFELVPGEVDLRDTIEEIHQIFSADIKAKGLRLVEDMDPELPPILLLDEIRLRQILFNLVGNAIKFTADGQITLTVQTATADLPDRVHLAIAVADTGEGVATDMQQEIFEAFQQQPGHGVKFGGTGLGLAISRRLVEMMNGTIHLESTPGQGSTFTIRLKDVPAMHPTETDKAPPPASLPQFQPATVLIVDDVAANRMLLNEVLGDQPFTLFEAENGREALMLARSVDFDLVLLDMKMPVMNGYETIEQIRADEKLHSLFIIAVTASVMRDSQSAMLAAGCDGFLKKPVRKADLYHEMARFLPVLPSQVAPPPIAVGNTPKPPSGTETLSHVAHHGLPELQRLLEGEMMTRLNSIQETMLTNDFNNFGQTMEELGRQYALAFLQDYGVALRRKAELFDTSAMMRMLGTYPDLIARVKVLRALGENE